MQQAITSVQVAISGSGTPCVVLHLLAAMRRNASILHIPMAKRPRDADADADADAHSAHSAVRMCRVLPRPLPPRPVEQIVAAESAKAERGASVSATIDDNDSNQWDAYYTARYLRFNANTGSEETRLHRRWPCYYQWCSCHY